MFMYSIRSPILYMYPGGGRGGAERLGWIVVLSRGRERVTGSRKYENADPSAISLK